MRKPFVRKIAIGVLAVVGLFGVGIAAYWPWSVFIILMLFSRGDRSGGPFDVWTSSDCTPQKLATVLSPDARLEASVFHVLCTAPLEGFFTNTADHKAIVIVARGDAPSGDATVMNINLGFDESQLMRWDSTVVWRDMSRLQITLPESASVWDEKPTVAGVAIDVQRISNRATP